jgi:DNA-binding XRE family transcriptional regulator
MGRHHNFNELRAKMSPERLSRIKTEADALHRDYVLSQIRRQVGFTQMEVAKRLGISQPTYPEFERGSNMRIGTLQKIVAALGGELLLQVKLNGVNFDLQMKA